MLANEVHELPLIHFWCITYMQSDLRPNSRKGRLTSIGAQTNLNHQFDRSGSWGIYRQKHAVVIYTSRSAPLLVIRYYIATYRYYRYHFQGSRRACPVVEKNRSCASASIYLCSLLKERRPSPYSQTPSLRLEATPVDWYHLQTM